MSTIEKAVGKFNSEGPKKGSDSQHGSSKITSDNEFVEQKKIKGSQIQLPWNIMQEKGMLTPSDGKSQIAEELRAIKRPLLKSAFQNASSANNHNNLIMLTSSVPGEGKSFNSINLAVSIAMELDRTALLVDADVAKPSISKYLAIKNNLGLVDFLQDSNLSLSDVILKTDLPKLSVIPAGSRHNYSTELLASESMKILMDELATRYHDRVVIFDSPPVLATSETEVLATQMGQVVVVVEAVNTSKAMLSEAISKLSNSNVVGLILNKTRVKSGGSTYGYGYGYGDTLPS